MTDYLYLSVFLLTSLCVFQTSTGQYFMLNGQRYNNHSLIRMESVGQVANAVYCVTTYRPCCKAGKLGSWYYPDGSQVQVHTYGEDFYRNRSDVGAVVLHRRNDALGPNGKYSCVIPDDRGVSTRLFAGIYSALAFPTVITQPRSIVDAIPGSTITFSIIAVQATSYNWVFNDVYYLEDGGQYSGTTTSSLTIRNVFEANEGKYHCVVVKELSVSSDVVNLTVLDPPVIEMHPLSAFNIELGSSVTFTVLAVGPDLMYEWTFADGSPLPDNDDFVGVATPTFTIHNVALEDVDSYRCVVSNGAGTVHSAIANMSLEDPPVIEAHPQNATNIQLGSSVSFQVLAVGKRLSYKWEFGDGTPLPTDPNYIGVDTPTFTIQSVAEKDTTSYRCAVSNTVWTVYSNAASISLVGSGPVNSLSVQPGVTSANVTWKPSVSEGVLVYQIVYYHKSFPGEETSVNVTDTSYIAMGLLPRGRYRFKVQQIVDGIFGAPATVDVKLTGSIRSPKAFANSTESVSVTPVIPNQKSFLASGSTPHRTCCFRCCLLCAFLGQFEVVRGVFEKRVMFVALQASLYS